jgi:hypothetical protein
MGRQLDHSYLSFLIHSGTLKRSAQDPFSVDRIEAEVTAKLFRCLLTAVCLVHPRSSRQPYSPGLPYQRADQAIDEQGGGVGPELFMFSVLQLEHVSGILYQSMLKPASGADKGSPVLAGELNPA